MEHFYENIEGWFDYKEIYSLAVDRTNNGGIFVEVGTWLGKSIAFLGVSVINSGKNITVYGIDNFSGSPDESNLCGIQSEPSYLLKKVQQDGPEKLKEEFIKNIEPVSSVVRPIFKNSFDAINMFDDNSIDFCFIDSDHAYENIKREIEIWYPKVKSGGMIGGHDLQLSTVARAVTEKFGGTFTQHPDAWLAGNVLPEDNFCIHYGGSANTWYHFKK